MPLESFLAGLTKVNQALTVATAAKRLTDGLSATDDAVGYLRGEGLPHVATALDGLMPGLGQLVGTTSQSVDALGNALTTIEGEYRVLDDDDPEPATHLPWMRFCRHWWKLPSGGELFLGPYGSGKTMLMNHLAARIADRHNYSIEYMSVYSDDRKLPGDEVSAEKLATRVARIVLSLNPGAADDEQPDPDDDDAAVKREANTQWRKFLTRVRDRYGVEDIHELRRIFGRKIILIDEAGTDILGGMPNDPYRQAVIKSLDQCRHVEWRVLMATQRARSIPKDPISISTVWVKQPTGRELSLDTGNNRKLREIWEGATEAFAGVRRNPHYADYPDPRAWAWVDSPPRDRWRGWQGMVPYAKDELLERAG